MRAEIGEPLQRERRAEREELPPVAGCGYSDPNFDPMTEWSAREAAKPKAQTNYGSIMPGVEAMPNWRQFVGWIEPNKSDDHTKPKLNEKAYVSKVESADGSSDSKIPSPKVVEEPLEEAPTSVVQSAETEGATVIDLDLAPTIATDDTSLDLGDLGMTSVTESD